MADKYTIDFTDQNTNRSFIVTPFSVNGPVNPTSGMLDPMATTASTSLRLVGKGLPEYGERVLENLVHLLEHFAGDKEPTYPINGQIWFNKQVTPQQLCVYNSLHSVLRPSVAHPANVSWYYVDGDQVARLSGLQKIRIINGTTGIQEEYTISDVSLKLALTPENPASVDRTEFKISPPPSTSRANSWYIGGWEYVLQNNAPLRANFNANNHRIINLSTPILNTDAATKQYVDTEILEAVTNITNTINDLSIDDLTDVTIVGLVNSHVLAYDNILQKWINKNVGDVGAYLKTGGTITGNVTIEGTLDTTDVTIVGSIFQTGGNVSLVGGVDVEGNIGINGDITFVSGSKIILPGIVGSFTQNDQVVNKLYVDSMISSSAVSLGLEELTDVQLGSLLNNDILIFDQPLGQWTNIPATSLTSLIGSSFVQLNGDTMTGVLILSQHPSAASPALQAATKGYVDSAIANVSTTGGSGGVVSGEYLSDEDMLILHQGADLILPVLVADDVNDAFEVDGDLTMVFKEGAVFEVRCSTLTSYTVALTGASYDVGMNITTIPVTADLLPGMVIDSCEINNLPVVSADDVTDSFTISGDYTVDFSAGTIFSFVCWSPTTTSYVVEAPGSTYNVGIDRTVIPVTTAVPTGLLTSGPCEISGTGFRTADVYIPMNIAPASALKTFDVNHPVVGYDQYATDYPTNIWETTLLNNLVTAGASREISLRNIIEEFSTLFGAFAEPKYRQIIATTGTASYTLSSSYPVGTNDLSVYVNGIKQIASERSERNVVGSSKKWPSMDTGLLNTQSYGFRIRLDGAGSDTQIKFGGELGAKYYNLIETLNSIGNTSSTIDVQSYDPDTETIIVTGNKAYLFPAAKTFVFESDGPPLTQVTLTVTGAGATYDTGTQTTRIPVTTNLQPTVLKVGVTSYPIIAKDSIARTFTVSGNQTSIFTIGLSFVATCATTPFYSTSYTVLSTPTYNGTNTTIPVTEVIYSYGYALTNCRINYTGLGFGVTMSSEGGLKFVSDTAGSGSDVILTDGGVSGALNLFATLFTTPSYSGTGSITADYSYKEMGSHGKLSDVFEFHAASTPPVGSVIEIIVDRRVIR